MDNVTYLAARPMTVLGQEVNIGDEVDPTVFPYLEAMVDSGFLCRVFDGNVGALPAHVYSAVMTRRQFQEKVEGDPTKVSRRDLMVARLQSETQQIVDRENGPSPKLQRLLEKPKPKAKAKPKPEVEPESEVEKEAPES